MPPILKRATRRHRVQGFSEDHQPESPGTGSTTWSTGGPSLSRHSRDSRAVGVSRNSAQTSRRSSPRLICAYGLPTAGHDYCDTPSLIRFRNRSVSLNDQMESLKTRTGRPSKGDRDAFMVRPPRAVGNAIRERAEQAGMHYGEYIAAVLACAVDMPDLAPLAATPANQEALPIKRTA
jgi:hypothetical protein